MTPLVTIRPVCDAILLNVLFPHLTAVHIEELSDDAGVVRICARAQSDEARCPACGNASTRVHGWYERQLADAPVAGRPVVIRLRVRKFICQTLGCARRIFTEQLAGLTVRHGRRSLLLFGLLATIAFAGRSRWRAPRPPGGDRGQPLDPAAVGAGSTGTHDRDAGGAWGGRLRARRGRVYGTVLIDLDNGRPIDVLADRKAETLRDWLEQHPGVEIICRDRAGAYAEGARAGAPDAVQVADRWHLWHNLGDAVEKTVTRHHACLREPVAEASQPAVVADVAATPVKQSRLVVRTQERYAAIQRLLAEGCSIRGIARKLDLERGTVYRFARAASLDELLTKSTCRGTLLDDFKPYLHRRWNEGCTNVARLFAEIQADGYRGGVLTVRRYLRPFRPPPPASSATTAGCS